ncbi:hypothetical protein F5888DRAFT_1634271 [Russula emetica]|nr:hypothetical protein F5888DRAFT_1634271 [Russula emetica]
MPEARCFVAEMRRMTLAVVYLMKVKRCNSPYNYNSQKKIRSSLDHASSVPGRRHTFHGLYSEEPNRVLIGQWSDCCMQSVIDIHINQQQIRAATFAGVLERSFPKSSSLSMLDLAHVVKKKVFGANGITNWTIELLSHSAPVGRPPSTTSYSTRLEDNLYDNIDLTTRDTSDSNASHALSFPTRPTHTVRRCENGLDGHFDPSKYSSPGLAGLPSAAAIETTNIPYIAQHSATPNARTKHDREAASHPSYDIDIPELAGAGTASSSHSIGPNSADGIGCAKFPLQSAPRPRLSPFVRANFEGREAYLLATRKNVLHLRSRTKPVRQFERAHVDGERYVDDLRDGGGMSAGMEQCFTEDGQEFDTRVGVKEASVLRATPTHTSSRLHITSISRFDSDPNL